MYYCIYNKNKLKQQPIIEAMAKGTGGVCLELKELDLSQVNAQQDCVVFIGLVYGMGDLYRHILANNINYIYIDHAYFTAGYSTGWFRCTRNNFIQNTIKTSNLIRPSFDQKIRPLRRTGSYILGLPSSDAVNYIFGDAHDWYNKICDTLSQQLGLPVVHRHKSPQIVLDKRGHIQKRITHTYKTSLDLAISGARCLVTYSSSVSIYARTQGCPVFVHERNAAYPVGENLETISNPPDRYLEPWIRSLSNSQFNLDEMQSGILDRL